jgi:predicted O-methyltransferase YrrM
MNESLGFLLRYLKYFIKAKNEYSLHSPFVFDLYTKVITDVTPFYIFEDIEKLRSALLQSNQLITVADYGAGSKIFKSNTRKVSDIARFALKSPKYSQLLFRLVNYLKPLNILELGTSLGISTLYLATPEKKNKVISLEGCEETIGIAKQNFKRLKVNNIEVMQGNFNQTLEVSLKKLNTVGMVFFDGNHQKAPTIEYFNQCLSYIHTDSFFIVDDIHWSREMEEAWNQIISHKQVTLSIDLFQIGIIFFREMQEKQNFILRF